MQGRQGTMEQRDIDQPVVSVVLISWKMRSLLERMLRTLIHHSSHLDMEVICIDNGSHDGTSEMVARDFPSVRLFCNPANRGVAPARNQGIKMARGRYIAILDADMELVEDALGPLVSFLDLHPEVGMVGCRLTFADGTTQLNAKRFPSLLALLARRIPLIRNLGGRKALNHHEMSDWKRLTSAEVDYLIGACQVIRSTIFDQVGLLDEQIFYGPEDIDFCLRIRMAGWKIWWLHTVRIIHHEQRITKRNPLSRISIKHYKGLFYFFRKHGLGYASNIGPHKP